MNLREVSKFKLPGAYIWRGDLTECFLRYEFRGLIHGGAHFRNFTVSSRRRVISQAAQAHYVWVGLQRSFGRNILEL